MAIKNLRQEDGTGVPPMPKARFRSNGELNFDEDDDLLDQVRKLMTLKYGEKEGMERLRQMDGFQILELIETEVKETFGEVDEEGVPPVPRLRARDGKLLVTYK